MQNYTIEDLNGIAVKIDKKIGAQLSIEIEKVREQTGDKIADEMLLSVLSMMVGKAVAIVNIWTGEPIESIAKRMDEVTKHHTKVSMKRYIEQFKGDK